MAPAGAAATSAAVVISIPATSFRIRLLLCPASLVTPESGASITNADRPAPGPQRHTIPRPLGRNDSVLRGCGIPHRDAFAVLPDHGRRLRYEVQRWVPRRLLQQNNGS